MNRGLECRVAYFGGQEVQKNKELSQVVLNGRPTQQNLMVSTNAAKMLPATGFHVFDSVGFIQHEVFPWQTANEASIILIAVPVEGTISTFAAWIASTDLSK